MSRDTTMNGAIDNDSSKSTKKKEKIVGPPQATVGETLSFVFGCGQKMTWIFFVGLLGGIANGFVYPILAFMFSTAFTDISGATTNGIGQVRELAYTFMVIGVYALFAGFVQTWSFEVVSFSATQNLRLQWFSALLRQDAAFFDVYDASGIAGQIGPSMIKYQRGLGRKFGEGIQFFVTGIGGFGFAMWSSWRTALVVLGLVPLIAVCALSVLQLNQSKGTRGAAAYKTAGSVAYTTVSAIKTVLSLNAIGAMIQKYADATQEAYAHATGILIKQGLANGGMLASFLLLYCVLALYGTALLYLDVRRSGCDPSGAITDNDTCRSDGAGVFGAMLGIAFAAQGASQFGSFAEAFAQARVSVHIALQVIRRLPGAPEETIFRNADDEHNAGLSSTTHSKKSNDIVTTIEGGKPDKADSKAVKAILPKYEIDSTSADGAKPEHISGRISFKDVTFSYPTRPHEVVLNNMSTEIESGKTVAFVGPSGSGKSTIVAMLERFYDPISGSIEIDGTNVKSINVGHLRSAIGYVGQEPTLFATSIRANIQYGNPKATFEQIQEAARLANAHDFISAFPDGYDTQVGDKGSQLSGGQKQRIAIARVLVGKPRILILDEATSALDSESELVVQEALDNILDTQKITTVIIAHRLSTIRGCDTINVLRNGVIVESGTHDELMNKEGYYYELVMKQEGGMGSKPDSSTDLAELSNDGAAIPALPASYEKTNLYPHISFKDVNFSYPTRPKKVVFDEFNLDIELGSTVALVGPSGGGKSTTVGLIERFYDPVQGSVCYEGTDIRTLNVQWYRDQIGYVGQEPTLFNDTIANNIAYGAPLASRYEVEEAAKQANAYDFIMEFSDGFDTLVGERGAQLSGGQKQRVAIARALVKKPRILILDEATSALDTHSEAIVQEAIDKLMSSRDQTCIVIAHRLSTIKSADKIAFIANGKVLEQGTHEELVAKPHGRYKRLFDSSRRETKMTTAKLKDSETNDKADETGAEEEEGEINWDAKFEEEETKAFSASRARKLAAPDTIFMIIGAIGAMMAGSIFPMWGLLFAETIDLLFRPVYKCTGEEGSIPICPPPPRGDGCMQYPSCQEYWSDASNMMQDDSYILSLYWTFLLVGCIIGNVLLFWGFGMASERLNKRVRDSAFSSLVRQEVAFFDKRSVGSITSQLQDDAARLQAFSGEPVRSLLTAMSSIIIGVTLSFIFMWPFALLAIGCIPLMGFATSLEMKQMLGEDESSEDKEDDDNNNSPGGVLVETLLNMRTVSALTLEQQRYNDYEKALLRSDPNASVALLVTGITGGISMFIQQWINALQLWFGGWLLVKFPLRYEFRDFLISNFAVLFALFGLGAAFQDISDRKEVEKSAGRIFYLLDRVSEIDPLGTTGKVLGNDTIHATRSKYTKDIYDNDSNKKSAAITTNKSSQDTGGEEDFA